MGCCEKGGGAVQMVVVQTSCCKWGVVQKGSCVNWGCKIRGCTKGMLSKCGCSYEDLIIRLFWKHLIGGT